MEKIALSHYDIILLLVLNAISLFIATIIGDHIYCKGVKDKWKK